MGTTGVIQYTSIPGWPTPAPGLAVACEAGGVQFVLAPDGVHVSDLATANSIISSYSGSATELAWNKAALQTKLAALYISKFAAGFNYTGPDSIKRSFQLDATSQFNIDVQANASLGSILNGETWDTTSYFIAADNSHMPTATPKDMRAFSLAARQYVATIILNNRALKDQIIAAPDMKTLNAIDLNSGWPSNP